MKCTYTIGKTKYNSYTELLDVLENKTSLDNISDIVYSKYAKQEAQVNLIDKKTKEYNASSIKLSPSFLNGEPSLDKAVGVLDYINSGKFIVNGHKPISPYVEADYIKNKTSQLVDQGLSLEDAQNQVKNEIKNNKKILEDSLLFHDVFNDLLIANPDGTAEKFVARHKDKFKKYAKAETLLTDLYNELSDIYKQYKGFHTESIIKRNVNLTAKTKDGDTIVGHIDQLIIDNDGTAHIYIFKTTSEHPIQWINAKKSLYDYQLSFLKQILKVNGINVNNISLNLIPVELKYNDDYSDIKSVRIHPIQERSVSKNNTYTFEELDKYTRVMIPNTSTSQPINSGVLSKADEIYKAIFPTLNIKEQGIKESARLWIKNAPSVDPTGTQQLVIREVNTDHRYDVIINGKVYPIKSGRTKIANTEILNLVIDHINDLEDNKGYSIQKLKNAIQSSYKKGFVDISDIKGLKGSEIKLNGLLNKYIHLNENKEHDWILETDLIDSSVIIFRNKHTDTLDFIDLSAFDVNAIAKLSKGPGILGAYQYQDQIGLKSDYGNIEAVRTMVLINQMIPSIKDKKLGTIHVVSAVNNSNYRTYNISDFNSNFFQKIISFVSNENKDLNITNNFFNVKMEDGVDTILYTLKTILDGKSPYYANNIYDLGFMDLQMALTQEARINALYNIIQNIYNNYPDLQNPDNVRTQLLYNNTSKINNIAKLLNLVTIEYLSLTGESPEYKTKTSWLSRNAFTTTTIADRNLKIVVDNLQICHDNIANQFLKNYNKVNRPFETFYKEIGYTSAQNKTIGNQASQFNNLFKKDFDTGENTMTFKNPYDMSEDLTMPERKLLKQILFQIADIHSNHQMPFKSAEDPKIEEYIKGHPEYLWCPLIRASKATAIQNKDAWLAKIKNSWKRYRKAVDRFDEFYNGVTAEEREILSNSEDFYKMTLRNPFDLSIPNNVNANRIEEKRHNMIEKYGSSFFETNLENIMKEFLVQHIGTQEFNKMLIGTKALMLQLYLHGITSGNQDIVQEELKWLQDYLKANIFKESPMSKEGQKIIGTIMPIKHAVSHLLIAGNVKSMFRDLFEGVQQNFLRSVLQYQTDLKPKYITEAMTYVSSHSTTNAMAVNLLSKLCLKYRLSNTDVGRIAERSKTGRNGLVNIENGLYFTLRGPDFFNRMTLFVARCMQDGVWGAYSIDEDGDLKYDWRKDERFIQYANGNISSPLYNQQKALYLSKIRQWNLEHTNPENKIEYNGDLPTPYTDKEILYIRNLGDNIYGSYDKSKRAMMEQYTFINIFGMFTTWMNGIVNNYFMESQSNNAFGYNRVQATDTQGRKLYFDDLNNITTEITDLPVYNDEPIVIQGIFGTLKTLYNILTSDETKGFGNGYRELKKYLESDPHERANLRKLLSDVLMSLLYLLLYKYTNPAYKEFKKNMQDNPVLVNATVEVLYGGLSRAGDQNNGPLNIVTFLGENMNPPVYTQPVQLIGNVTKSVFGEREWKYTIANFSGLTRSFRDTSIAYLKSKEE